MLSENRKTAILEKVSAVVNPSADATKLPGQAGAVVKQLDKKMPGLMLNAIPGGAKATKPRLTPTPVPGK